VIAQPNAAVNPAPTAPAPTGVTCFVGPLQDGPANVAVQVQDYGGFEAVFGEDSDSTPTALAVRQFFDNGGELGYVVRSADAAAGARASRALHQGMYALEEVEAFNLLCMPGTSDAGVLSSAEGYCRDRGALLLADAPLRAETPAQVLASISGGWPRSSHAAVFHPWVYVEGKDGKRHVAPPSGGIAGMLARNDATRGVWKAPAGRQAHLEGVCALHASLEEAEATRLAEAGVNCLRMASSLGAVCWSARTLHPSDRPTPELAQIPVRRMANFLEDSLVPALYWTRFERNDATLWAHIAAQAEEFMHGLFTAGAFQGDTEAQAYFVRCGTDTIRSEDLTQGRVGIDLGFAPLKPGEFVRVRIHCLAEARP
jgi:phage tail sheath protein FI